MRVSKRIREGYEDLMKRVFRVKALWDAEARSLRRRNSVSRRWESRRRRRWMPTRFRLYHPKQKLLLPPDLRD